MPATTNQTPSGRRTRRPGAYSRIDTTAAQIGGAGIKRVALVGEAQGGVPVTVTREGRPAVEVVESADGLARLYAAGPLRDAGELAFNASNDPRVGQPSQLLLVKVNPATPGTLALVNALGAAIDLASEAYGEAANRIGVQVVDSPSGGYQVTVEADGGVVEGVGIGADAVLVIGYDGEAAVGLQVGPTGLDAPFAHALAADPVSAAHTAGSVARVRSTSAADVGQRVIVYGVDANDLPIFDAVILDGLNVVSTARAFEAITGQRVVGLTAGDVTVDDTGGKIAFVTPAGLAAVWTPGFAKLSSSSEADVGKRVTLVGVDAGGTRITAGATLDGTTVVSPSVPFVGIREVHLAVPLVGNLTVADAGDVAVLVVPAGATDRVGGASGLFVPQTLPVDGALTLTLTDPPLGAPFVVVRGISKTGAALAVRSLVTDLGTTTAELFDRLDQIELGVLEAGSELTVSGSAFTAQATALLRDVADKVARLPGFTCALKRIADGGLPLSTLDETASADIKTVDLPLRAALHDLVAWFNDTPTGLVAARATGATLPPDAMPAPAFLVGGGEGQTTAEDWAAAFDALRAYRDVIVVPLSTEASVHAQLRAHCRRLEADRIGADERNGYVGLGLTLGRAGIADAILEINDRNVAACAQAVTVRDPRTGAQREYGPAYFAVMLAAMQAGTPIGEAQTWKRPNVVRFRQSADWNPMDAAEAMLEAGLIFLRDSEAGVVVERAITTYRDDDAIFTEVGANEAANESIKRARRRMQAFVGERRFDGRASSLRSVLNDELQSQLDEGLLAAFDPEATTVVTRGDAFEFAYRGTPVPTINFVNLTFFASAA